MTQPPSPHAEHDEDPQDSWLWGAEPAPGQPTSGPPGGIPPGTPPYELPEYLRQPDRLEFGRHLSAVPYPHPTGPDGPPDAAAFAGAGHPAAQYPPPEYPGAEYPGTRYSPDAYPADAYPAGEYPVPGDYPAPEYPSAAYLEAELPTRAMYPAADLAEPGTPHPGPPQPGALPEETPPYARQPDADAEFGPNTYVAAEPSPAPTPAPPPAPPVIPRPEALLLPPRNTDGDEPAHWGWRGKLTGLSGGLLRLSPSTDELADRAARREIQRSFSRPMTVVVISPKGGAGKTPTTVGLAAALGTHRGGYVVGWDDNETRGTLAVRVTNDSDQRTTVWDLLGALPVFERTDARVGDLSHYVRSQGDAHFDALVSDDNPANMAQIGDDEFHRIHAVLERFYRQIIIDTGNNVRSLNWQAAVNAADLIVVVSTYQRDAGYSGSWVLDHLSETGRTHLASRAITVLTAADPKPDPVVRGELLAHFGARTQAVVEIPYDPAIALGGPIEWHQLRPETQRAWTKAGATVVHALAATDEHERLANR